MNLLPLDQLVPDGAGPAAQAEVGVGWPAGLGVDAREVPVHEASPAPPHPLRGLVHLALAPAADFPLVPGEIVNRFAFPRYNGPFSSGLIFGPFKLK